jgi:hypothetical protein
MSVTNYNDPFLISKVLSALQKTYSEQCIGEYVRHSLSTDGRGLNVWLSNGTILITYDALASAYELEEMKEFLEVMINTFVRDKGGDTSSSERGRNRMDKFLEFFAGKKTRVRRNEM